MKSFLFLLVPISLLGLVTACSGVVDRYTPDAVIYVNQSRYSGATIQQVPIKLTVKTFFIAEGTVEIFDGVQPLGVISTGTRDQALISYEFVYNPSKQQNGTRTFSALWTSKSNSKETFQAIPTTITLALP